MSARGEILSRIRAQLAGRPPAGVSRVETTDLLPLGAVRGALNLTELFLTKLKQVSGTSSRIETLAELPAHLAALLSERTLAPAIVLAPEPAFAALPWREAGLSIAAELDPLAPATVVSRAAAGIAETGSFMLTTSGASRPVHNLLSEQHIVVLGESEIVATPEEALRMAVKQGVPRGAVFITGASRTADIEMTLELGAHGAVGVHIVLVASLTVQDSR